jgi:hypothetical protein
LRLAERTQPGPGDFTLTADLLVDGFVGNEAVKAEFTVGCAPTVP